MTLFHVLWLGITIGSAIIAARAASGLARTVQILALTGGGAFAFVGIGLVVFLTVTLVIVPCLRHGTYWEYEVECHMLHVLGHAWKGALKGKGTAGDDKAPGA